MAVKMTTQAEWQREAKYGHIKTEGRGAHREDQQGTVAKEVEA